MIADTRNATEQGLDSATDEETFAMTIAAPIQPTFAARDDRTPLEGVRVSYLVVMALVALALIAVVTGLGATPKAAPVREPIQPVSQSQQLPVEPVVAPEVKAPSRVVSPQVATPPTQRTSPQPVGGAGAAQGGDTDVTISNGSNDTDTASGGSHVNNNADLNVSSSTGEAGP